MTHCRQKAFPAVILAIAALFSYQVNSFSQVSPVGGNSGYRQPNQPVMGTYPAMTGNPTGTMPTGTAPTGAMPTGTMPQGTIPGSPAMGTAGVPSTGMTATNAPGNGATPNYMIDRPLGTMPNTPGQNSTQPGTMQPGVTQPGMTPNNQSVVQNGRQIIPNGYVPGPEEQNYINGFLNAWSEQSENIEAIHYDFTRANFNSFGKTETYGRVKFRAPNKGLFEVHSALVNDKRITETNEKQKIICTGDAVYNFSYDEKKLTEYIIPQEQRGKGTLDSPLMVIVKANPQELQDRFYLRALRPWSKDVENCYCFEATPKWVEDSRDFQSVELAIDKQYYNAKELRVFKPGGSDCEVYQISNPQKSRIGAITSGITDRIFPKDEFDREAIIKSKPRDWMFETKNDFLPEASGQQFAQQPNPMQANPNPQYGGAVNTPNSPGMQPQLQPGMQQPNQFQNVQPNQTQLSYNNGTPIANAGQYGTASVQTDAYPANPNIPMQPMQNQQPGNPQQYNTAMPPQNTGVSPSMFR